MVVSVTAIAIITMLNRRYLQINRESREDTCLTPRCKLPPLQNLNRSDIFIF